MTFCQLTLDTPNLKEKNSILVHNFSPWPPLFQVEMALQNGTVKLTGSRERAGELEQEDEMTDKNMSLQVMLQDTSPLASPATQL